jgi:hypothetical protein
MADSTSGTGGTGGDMDDKLKYFQDVTGLENAVLAEQILFAHNWDIDAAVGAMMDKNVIIFLLASLCSPQFSICSAS